MKRLVRIIVLGVLLYVAWLAFLCSCSSPSGEVRLRNVDDSLSYAVSMLVSEELPGMLAAEGIDSTTIDDFIRGVRAAFPLDDSPESRAYLNGVVVAFLPRNVF